jgi:Tol biopolymer transport system component
VSGGWKIRVASLDSDRVDDVLEADSNAAYANGFVLFVRKGTLLAQRLEDRTLRLAGQPVPIAEGVLHDVNLGRAVFSVAERSLVYQAGSAVLPSRLVWLDRNGNHAGTVEKECVCAWPRLDPQGTRAAVTVTRPGDANPDIHVYHLLDGRSQPLTFHDAYEGHAAWTADGNRIVFDSNRRGVASDLHLIDANGQRAEEPLYESDQNKFVIQVLAGGVVFREDREGEEDRRLWLLPLTKGAKPQQIRLNQPTATFGAVSPDGRWLAYVLRGGNGPEVFVTSFPGLTGNWPISQDGGSLPRWSRDGREIFYMTQDHATMYAVRINEDGGTLRPSRPERLFTTQMQVGRGYPYDVAPDGRFLAVVASGSTNAPLTLVVDWPSDLRR